MKILVKVHNPMTDEAASAILQTANKIRFAISMCRLEITVIIGEIKQCCQLGQFLFGVILSEF